MNSISTTITKLAQALLTAQKEMGDAKKGSSNPFFKSSYADLNSIREVVLPALNANGISVLQPTVVVDGKNYVNTLLLHESGEYMGSLTEIKVEKQNNPQAEGSGISYARRYGLQSFLNVGAVDDDGEKAVGRTKVTPKVESVALPNGTVTTVTTGNLLPNSGVSPESKAANATAGQQPATNTTTNGTKKSSFKKTSVVEPSGEWK